MSPRPYVSIYTTNAYLSTANVYLYNIDFASYPFHYPVYLNSFIPLIH